VWNKSRSSSGTGGFIRYAVSTCLNHLKSCQNHPPDIRQQAEVSGSPRKQRYSPYGTTWSGQSGVTPLPSNFPSGLRSSQMLPPSLPPSTRFNSPALHLQISPLPSPMISALPSPQLSALASPLIDTFPLSYGNYYGNPLHPNHSPAVSTPHSLHAELVTSHVSQTTLPLGLGDWSQELQVNFETQIARLTASAGLPLSWVDNPEWIDFIHQFLPAAKSPSRKVLMTRLIPHLVKDYRQVAKDSSRDQNATIQSDGWTGVNVRNFVFSTISSLIFQTSSTNSHAHSSLT